MSDEEVEKQKPGSWFYKKAAGGGSLIDYLGYGTTLGTWFHDGDEPIEVTAVVDETPGIEVDQHSITVARYAQGLQQVRDALGHDLRSLDAAADPEVRLHPRRHQGRDRELRLRRPTSRVQLRGGQPETVPVDEPKPGRRGVIDYMVERIRKDLPIDGPLSPETALVGQRILDTALAAAKAKRTLALLP